MARARTLNKTVVLPEGDDPRVISAAWRLRETGVATPILIGDPERFETIRREKGLPWPDFDVIDPRSDTERYILQLMEIRKKKGLTREAAAELVVDPLYRAALMVRAKEADAAVGGAVRTTADTVRAALQCIGSGGRTVSSFFLMIMEQRVLLYADCGIIPFPNAQQLADIAVASARSWQRLTNTEPKVAMLSFSTFGSASDPSIEIINEAVSLVRHNEPDLCIDGDLQADAALIAEIGERKAPSSPVAGRANVLVFPNLHAGNIAYKLTERLAGAMALGPVLQGLQQPMNDLSRGCSTEDIVLVSAISAIQAGEHS